jgi:hypothetical protein
MIEKEVSIYTINILLYIIIIYIFILVESWSQGIVPHFITCNSFIGKSYAKVLLGFIRDCCTPGNHILIIS